MFKMQFLFHNIESEWRKYTIQHNWCNQAHAHEYALLSFELTHTSLTVLLELCQIPLSCYGSMTQNNRSRLYHKANSPAMNQSSNNAPPRPPKKVFSIETVVIEDSRYHKKRKKKNQFEQELIIHNAFFLVILECYGFTLFKANEKQRFLLLYQWDQVSNVMRELRYLGRSIRNY